MNNKVFAAAAQLVRVRLAERVEVVMEGGDKVKFEIGRAAPMVFTVGKDGLIYGPDTTVSAGNISDDSIRDVIANSLILKYSKRVARGDKWPRR
jgi:hypothetical protein